MHKYIKKYSIFWIISFVILLISNSCQRIKTTEKRLSKLGEPSSPQLIKDYIWLAKRTKSKGAYYYSAAMISEKLDIFKDAEKYILKSIKYSPNFYSRYENDSVFYRLKNKIDIKKIRKTYETELLKRNWHPNESIDNEIQKIYSRDIYYRLKMDSCTKTTNYNDCYQLYRNKQKDDDAENTLKIDSLIAKFGWIDFSNSNEKSSLNICILALHAKPEKLKEYFKLYKKSFKKRQTYLQYYAFMQDRILMHDGKKQIFGTQSNVKDGKKTLYPLKSPKRVNIYRFKLGLSKLKQ